MVAAQNPIAQLQARFKNLENGFRAWLAKQTLPVEATVVTATSAAQGAAIGVFMGTLTNDATSAFPTSPLQANLNPQAMASFKQAQALAGGPLVQAQNFDVMTVVNAGISCVMKRIRGKEDVQSSMLAAFGSRAILIGERHGWPESDNQCNFIWALFLTYTRWNFSGWENHGYMIDPFSKNCVSSNLENLGSPDTGFL